MLFLFLFFKQKTAYEMRISDWSSDVCSSDLGGPAVYAYAETPMQNESGSMMQDGQDGMMGQGGMMNMMQQMSQMMETCNNMMQEMSQHHEPEAPKEGVVPDKEG